MTEYTAELIQTECATCHSPVNILLAGECASCYDRHRRQARKIVTGVAILVLALFAAWVAGRA